jgi:hypothetical protein
MKPNFCCLFSLVSVSREEAVGEVGVCMRFLISKGFPSHVSRLAPSYHHIFIR